MYVGSCGYIDLCVTGAVFSNNELGSINHKQFTSI